MNILGVSAFYHDSAACLVRDGEIITAAQEERFSRKKHDPRFPRNAIKYCLEEAGIKIQDLNYVVYYDKPLLTFERLLMSYLIFTTIILALTYYLVITPFGLIKRIIGGPILPVKPGNKNSSFWVSRVEPSQPRERFLKRY